MMNAAKTIVAIGGGELKDLATFEIDRAIVGLTNKTHPHALFIPTASGDADSYWQTFQAVYGATLGCSTDVLWLLKEQLTPNDIEDKILSADLIYVGGGNTLSMMKRWRRLGVDTILNRAYAKGIVLSGISAGAICWFKYGLGESLKYRDPARWSFIRVRGLGFINALLCPHYHSVISEQDCENMLAVHGGVGIALEDHCALAIIDDHYRIVTSQADGRAYKLYKKRGKVVTEPIEQTNEFTSLSLLLKPH